MGDMTFILKNWSKSLSYVQTTYWCSLKSLKSPLRCYGEDKEEDDYNTNCLS